MHPGLVKLIRLQIRGARRRAFRGLKTLRGIFFFGFALLIFASWIGPGLVMRIAGKGEGMSSFREVTPDAIPVGLMIICVLMAITSAGQKAISFTPSEVDFLFSGPFHRRELLLFRLARSALAALFTSLVFSGAFLIYIDSWLAGFIGFFLTVMFIQLWSMTFALVGQSLGERLYTRARRGIAIGVGTLAVVALAQMLLSSGTLDDLPLDDLPELLRLFRETTAGTWLLALFEVFGRVITSERLVPDLAGWSALALLINLTLFGIVMRLDANYLEAAADIGRKNYERLQRFRRGGGAMSFGKPREARWTLPRFPWMAGAGPLAWQQITKISRSSRSLALLSCVMTLLGVGLTLMIDMKEPGNIGAPLAGIGSMAYMTFFISMQAPLAFRGELDMMDWLKSLPLGSRSIAVGELSGGVLVLTAIQLFFFGGIAFIVPEHGLLLLAAGAFTFPFNCTMLSVENLVFLLMPTRTIPTTPGDLQFMGRLMVLMFLKMLVLLVCFGISAGLGAIAFFLSGQAWLVATLVCWFALMGVVIALVQGVAWSFERFDVSVDIPA